MAFKNCRFIREHLLLKTMLVVRSVGWVIMKTTTKQFSVFSAQCLFINPVTVLRQYLKWTGFAIIASLSDSNEVKW